MAKLWQGRENVIRLGAAVTPNTGAALDTFLATGSIEAHVMDWKLESPTGPIDIQLFMGQTSGFQNAELDKKPFTLAKFTCTIRLDGDETIETHMGGAGTAITGGFTRYQYGDSTTAKTRVAKCLLINLDDSTDECNLMLNNAWVVNAGEIGEEVDGHVDIKNFEIVCLPKDFYAEFKD